MTEKEEMHIIAKTIKYRRELLGMTQKDLAKYSGVSPASISRYERELKHPRGSKLIKICRTLGLSVYDFEL